MEDYTHKWSRDILSLSKLISPKSAERYRRGMLLSGRVCEELQVFGLTTDQLTVISTSIETTFFGLDLDEWK